MVGFKRFTILQNSMNKVTIKAPRSFIINCLNNCQSIIFKYNPRQLQFLSKEDTLLQGKHFCEFSRKMRLQRQAQSSHNLIIGVSNNYTYTGRTILIWKSTININFKHTRGGGGGRREPARRSRTTMAKIPTSRACKVFHSIPCHMPNLVELSLE